MPLKNVLKELILIHQISTLDPMVKYKLQSHQFILRSSLWGPHLSKNQVEDYLSNILNTSVNTEVTQTLNQSPKQDTCKLCFFKMDSPRYNEIKLIIRLGINTEYRYNWLSVTCSWVANG